MFILIPIFSGKMKMTPGADPSCGSSDHYQGSRGETYYGWQSGSGALGGRIETHKFQPQIRPEFTVLDFGCGGGFVLAALECARKIGVEVNPEAVQHAASLGLELHRELSDVPDGIVDIVISNHALEHVPYPIEALKELRQKLKPGGKAIICLPIDDWRNQKKVNPNDRNHHLHTWTPQLFANMLSEAGFQSEEIRVLTHYWPPRFTRVFYERLPLWAFDAICTLCAILLRRRQLMAIARPIEKCP